MRDTSGRDRVPAVSEALVKYVEEVYPARCARLGETQEEIWFRAGQNSVAEHLRKLLDEQEKH